MHGDEDYMDEDGPEFIQMVNDLVHNVRTETSTIPPNEFSEAYRISQIQYPSPLYTPSRYSSVSSQRSNALGNGPRRLGTDRIRQSSTTSRHLRTHLESMMNNSSSAVQDEIFIVLDTNILISHQDHVKSLIADIEHRQRNVVVVIPWVVLEELDNIKSRRDNDGSRVAGRAQGAIIFLQNVFSRKSPALRGQQVIESADTTFFTNDDRILDCCRYFSRKDKHEVILYSNDRNLCVKCMVHQIDAFGSSDQRKLLDIVDNAPRRQVITPQHALSLTQQGESSSSSTVHNTEADDVFIQVTVPRRQSASGHRAASYSSDDTSSRDSVYASNSSRLQESHERPNRKHKENNRTWNAGVLERYRNKQKDQQQIDDECAMDIDDDFPPPMPQGTFASIHSFGH